MACICANELKRFLSGSCCFRETDDLPLRLATSVLLKPRMCTTRGG